MVDDVVDESEPEGCPACNPSPVHSWMDAHRLVPLAVVPETPGAVPCERCGKTWYVVSLETAESPAAPG